MKVITLLNEKGGVGKTTLATHIAVGLAINGCRVLLVDADPQANATTAFGVPKSPLFHDLIVRHFAWKDVIRSINPDDYGDDVGHGRLMIVPGNAESRVVPMQISNGLLVRQRFRELANVVDYIIVDTSPTPSLLHSSIVMASDYIIAPTDCEAFSALDGLVHTIHHTQGVSEQAQSQGVSVAQLVGIVPNKFRANTMTHTEVLDYLKDKYGGLIWDAIPLAIVFSQSQLQGKFLYQFAPESKATMIMMAMVERIEELQ